jgi:HK97 family phage portal protein
MGLSDFLRWRSVPPMPQPIERRDSLAAVIPAWREGKPTYPDRDPATYDQDAYRKLALVFRCTTMVANSIAAAPLKVYQEAEPEPKELPSHRMRRLIKRPNPRMGEFRLMSMIAMTMATSGFCVVQKVRSNAGIPVQLWPLRSDLLYPMQRSQTAPDWEYRIKRVTPDEWDGRISDNGYPIIDSKDAIVLTWADTPDARPTGIGPLEVALREWGVLNTMQDFVQRYFDNGAMPRWGLKVLKDGGLGKGESAVAAADLIREMWAGRFMGRRYRDQRDIPILETVEPVRIDDSLDDMALLDLRNVSEVAICQAFGLHPTMVAQYFGLEHSTYSNAETYKQSYYEETIVPLWARIDDALSFGLLRDIESDETVYLEFDTDDIAALQEDVNLRRDHFLRGFVEGGITRAAYKRALGLPVEPGDDIYLIPFNKVEVPAGEASVRVTAEQAERLAPAIDNLLLLAARNYDVLLSSSPVSTPVHSLSDPDTERRDRGLVPLEMRGRIESRAVAHYNNTARLFSPKIMLFFRSQGRRVVEQLIDEAFWLNEDDELDQVLRQLWNAMGTSATADVSAMLGVDDLVWDIANPWVQDVQSLLATRVKDINETTSDDIRRIVTQSLDEGVSMPDLADRLRGQFEETYRGRSETIARTESQVAYNEASAKGYGETGVSEIELMDNPNHTTDPGSDGLTCAQRNGLIVPLSDASKHIAAEHPNGTLAIAPVITLG